MGFGDKIEKIRQKPEHIRIRYVWFSVAASMLFVIIIWIFSIQSGIKPIEVDQESASAVQKQLQGIKDSAPSINELFDTAKSAKETITNPEIQNNLQNQDQAVNPNENQPNNNDLNKTETSGEEIPSFPKE